MLWPMPPLKPGSAADRLLDDLSSFDLAATIPRLGADVAEFFLQHLRPAR
jgi:hypothetical protein